MLLPPKGERIFEVALGQVDATEKACKTAHTQLCKLQTLSCPIKLA